MSMRTVLVDLQALVSVSATVDVVGLRLVKESCFMVLRLRRWGRLVCLMEISPSAESRVEVVRFGRALVFFFMLLLFFLPLPFLLLPLSLFLLALLFFLFTLFFTLSFFFFMLLFTLPFLLFMLFLFLSKLLLHLLLILRICLCDDETLVGSTVESELGDG